MAKRKTRKQLDFSKFPAGVATVVCTKEQKIITTGIWVSLPPNQIKMKCKCGSETQVVTPAPAGTVTQ